MRYVFWAVLLLTASLSAPALARDDLPPAEGAHSADSPGALDGYLERAQELAFQAMTLIGIRYRPGGISPDSGFDCSGLVRYVFGQVTGLDLPNNARAISLLGRKIDEQELRPGDLVFYNTLSRPFSHVGIYLGERRFVHAPSRGGGVHIVAMDDSYWIKRFNGARRLGLR